MDCLVTKLKGTVDDSSLLKLNELRIVKKKASTWNGLSQGFSITLDEDAEISIIGDGYFTDYQGTANTGTVKNIQKDIRTDVFVSNNADVEISIPNKFALTFLNLRYPSSAPGYGTDTETNKTKSIKGGIESLMYCTKLTGLSLDLTGASGDISALKNLIHLTNLTIDGNDVYGSIDALSELSDLTYLIISNVPVMGDIKNLQKNTGLTVLNLYNSKVSGDISVLSGMTNLITLNLGSTDVSGDIAVTQNMANLTDAGFSKTYVGGDLSKLPPKIKFFSTSNERAQSFTWLGTRSSCAKIVALENINLGSYVDAMLINQANCTIGFDSGDAAWFKTITALGTRTSASDSAISTLQDKGYTVNVPEAD